jgi:hypothetical protein
MTGIHELMNYLDENYEIFGYVIQEGKEKNSSKVEYLEDFHRH